MCGAICDIVAGSLLEVPVGAACAGACARSRSWLDPWLDSIFRGAGEFWSEFWLFITAVLALTVAIRHISVRSFHLSTCSVDLRSIRAAWPFRASVSSVTISQFDWVLFSKYR